MMESDLMCSMESLNLSAGTGTRQGMATPTKTRDGEEDEGIPQEIESPTKSGEVEGSDKIQFNPPVYRQRYSRVRDVLQEFLRDPRHKDAINGNTVLEVGCAEYGMYCAYKSLLELGKVIFLDIDEQLLQERKYYLKPLPAEHLARTTRPKPLVMEAYAGCITKVDTRIIQENPRVWGIVAIELIEHLYPDVLRGFEISVFGVISPSIVVITTPNSDFNSVFNLPPGKFRHWDHKFEWTREEFQCWCVKICTEFPNYQYTVQGICEGPLETASLGCVSQMAIFQKVETGFTLHSNPVIYPGVVMDDAYKLVERVEYPNYIETRSPAEIIIQEFEYTVRTYWLSRRNVEQYMEIGKTELSFSLKDLPSVLQNIPVLNVEALRDIFTAAQYDVRADGNGEFSIVLQIHHYDINDERDSLEDEEMDDEPIDDTPCILTEADIDSWE